FCWDTPRSRTPCGISVWTSRMRCFWLNGLKSEQGAVIRSQWMTASQRWFLACRWRYGGGKRNDGFLVDNRKIGLISVLTSIRFQAQHGLPGTLLLVALAISPWGVMVSHATD